MKGFALFAISQCICVAALGQSAALPPGNLPASPGAPSPPPSAFHLDSTPSCHGASTAQNQGISPAGDGEFFHVPCINMNTPQEMARLILPSSPVGNGQRLSARFGAKGIPIPTEWPNVKPEPIPTTWPDLKIQRITAIKPGAAQAK